MPSTSAAICLWRRSTVGLEVLIVHPGGPFWAKKDDGAWSLPKGEFDPESEDGPAAARREFAEELGHEPPDGEPASLGETRLKSGKRILAWSLEGDLDVDAVSSNTFELQWPPRSGRRQHFPEVDRALWADLPLPRTKLNPAQAVFLDRLADQLDA